MGAQGMFVKLGFVVILSIAAHGVQSDPGTSSARPWQSNNAANLDDRDVIQAALLAVIKGDYWYWPEGTRERYAILGPHIKSSKRRIFADLLQREIKDVRHDVESDTFTSNHPPLGRKELKVLFSLRSQQPTGRYVAPSARQLATYKWDKHILMATSDAYKAGAKPRLKKSEGFVTAYLPAYSADGMASILDIEVPWGDFPPEVDTFLLTRKKNRWVVEYISVSRPL